MKHAYSLEEERQALLEQIHASRDAYRRMLMQADAPEKSSAESSPKRIGKNLEFPRSIAMRWVMQHPYLCVTAAAAIVVAVPLAARAVANRRNAAMTGKPATTAVARMRRSNAVSEESAMTRRTARTRSTDMAGIAGMPGSLVVAGRAAITGLVTAAAMLLRDPAKIRMAGRVFSTVAGFVQARRARRAQ